MMMMILFHLTGFPRWAIIILNCKEPFPCRLLCIKLKTKTINNYTDLCEVDGEYCMRSAACVIHTSTCCHPENLFF